MKSILLPLLTLLLYTSILAQEPTNIARKRILMLNSYGINFPTFKHVNQALEEYIDSTNTHVDIEFMDTKEFVDSSYIEKYYKLLVHKLSNRNKYDLLLVSDNNALDFTLKYQDSIFNSIPIVFFGINNFKTNADLKENEWCTGVSEETSIKETIEFAKKLNPELKEVIAITDNTKTSRITHAKYQKEAKNFTNPKLLSLKSNDYTYDQLSKIISRYHGQKAFLLIGCYHDKNKVHKNFKESLNLVLENSNIPTYHLWYHGINKGIVGGKLVHFYYQAQEALKIVHKILSGTPVSKIPVVEKSPNKFIVDYQIMEKFNLKFDDKNADVEIINSPSKLFSIDQTYFYFIVVIIVLITISLAFVTYLYINSKNLHADLVAEKNRAQENDRLKSAFLSNMSHEIRTPINGIVGFCDLLNDPESTPEENKTFTNVITKSSHHLLRTINEILDISRIETKEMPVLENPVDIREVLIESYEFFLPQCNKKHLDFKLKIDIPKHKEVTITDRDKLTKILNNIISNAIKFTSEGKIMISCNLRDKYFELKIEDTGIGIAPEFQDAIFDRFRQVELFSKRRYEGTGLGLSITKSFVELMGGEIWFESTEGKGTTFIFTLPYKIANQHGKDSEIAS